MFQLINNNAGIFGAPTLELSTVQLPRRACIGMAFESCLFGDGVSEVVDQYATLAEAVDGHCRLAIRYNLPHFVR